MTVKTFTCPVVNQEFSEGTADAVFVVEITGVNADGSAYTGSVSGASLPLQLDLPVGTNFVAVISKTVATVKIASAPSALFNLAAPTTVTISVPDATQPAVVS